MLIKLKGLEEGSIFVMPLLGVTGEMTFSTGLMMVFASVLLTKYSNVPLKSVPLMAVVSGLVLYNGSVLAEVFRAGMLSVPRGQREAAYALGLRKNQVMRAVLLPQAIQAMLPTIVSQLVVLLKDTALGFLITYQELLNEARYLGSLTEFGRPIIPTALVIGAVYITLCTALSSSAGYLERRSRRTGRALPTPDARLVTAELAT